MPPLIADLSVLLVAATPDSPGEVGSGINGTTGPLVALLLIAVFAAVSWWAARPARRVTAEQLRDLDERD